MSRTACELRIALAVPVLRNASDRSIPNTAIITTQKASRPNRRAQPVG